MPKKKQNKKRVRASFRKQQNTRVRKRDFTKEFRNDAETLQDARSNERVSGKGDLTRKRTIKGENDDTTDTGFEVALDVDGADCIRGRVLRVHGLNSFVTDTQGKVWQCTVRGILKSLTTDLQHVVVAGDYVTIRKDDSGDKDQAVIIRVEPRQNQICRTSRKRQQIIVSNVDLALIVASCSQPGLKPNLIDRFLVTAEQSGIEPVVVINKIDLVDPADLQPVVGVWCQLGYRVILTSTVTGQGVEQLQKLVRNRDCVVTGQSGVGKSSILNAIEPGLELKVSHVSEDNQKGRHTTTTAQLIPLVPLELENEDPARSDSGSLYRKGHLVDTPGIRQMQLWDVIPEEVDGYFRDIRPFINGCRFPDCSHTHEDDCAVKWAVADGKIDARRYESYLSIRYGDDP